MKANQSEHPKITNKMRKMQHESEKEKKKKAYVFTPDLEMKLEVA